MYKNFALNEKQDEKARAATLKYGIPGLWSVLNKYSDHFDEILRYVKQNPKVTKQFLDEWAKAKWENENKAKPAATPEQKEKEAEKDKQFQNLTVEQVKAAKKRESETDLTNITQLANENSGHFNDILSYAKANMKNEDLQKWVTEQKPEWEKADKELQTNGNRVEDRTPSTDKDEEEKYPVDPKINTYINYLTDSFVNSLIRVANEGPGIEPSNDYKAAKNRIKKFYDYARAHNVDKDTLKIEDYVKEFKAPEKFEANTQMPQRVANLINVYKKCQNFDFRYTVQTGNYRFTNEYNQLYVLFYCLFLACYIIRDNPDNITKVFDFKNSVGKASMQRLYNNCVEILKKIHRGNFNTDANLEDLNIKGQSNKDTTAVKSNTIDAEAQGKEIAKAHNNEPLSSSDTAEGTEQKGAEGANSGENANTITLADLSWYEPIRKKYLEFKEKYIKQLKESQEPRAKVLLDDFNRKCLADRDLSELYKHSDKDIRDISVFKHVQDMFDELFDPSRRKEDTVYSYVPKKAVITSSDINNQKERSVLRKERRESHNYRIDTIHLLEQVRKDVDELEIIKKLKDQSKLAQKDKSQKKLDEAEKAYADAKTARREARRANRKVERAVAKAFSRFYFADSGIINISPEDNAKAAETVYCVTIFVIRYFGFSESSLAKTDEDNKREKANNWLLMLQQKYPNPEDKASILSKALYVQDISINMENDVFVNPDKVFTSVYQGNKARDFIQAAYVSLLNAKTSQEFQKVGAKILPDYLFHYLDTICFELDKKSKNNREYNPKKGLSVLRDGLADLFYDETLAKDKKLNSIIPDGDIELAKDADALYRLLGQTKKVNTTDMSSPSALLVKLFEKYLVYQDGDFRTKTRGGLRVRT